MAVYVPLAIRYFHFLAYTAVALLWGISLANGTVAALISTVWIGQLPDGTPFRTVYTGVPLLDFPIGILVAFFFYGTNGHDDGYQVFLVDAYSTLQSAFVWLYIEASRRGARGWITRPLIFGILWQCLGGAISLPLYYAEHLKWIASEDANRGSLASNNVSPPNGHVVGVLPFAFLIGAILPAIIGMAPGTWLGPASRTPDQHQLILFAWQPDPVWVALIVAVGTAISHRFDRNREERRWPVSPNSVRLCYTLAILCSATGHLYGLHRMWAENFNSRSINFARMYIPRPLAGGPRGVEDILVRGPWLFLQFDLIIIALSSLSWAFILLRSRIEKNFSFIGLATCMFIGSVVFGPGAVVSFCLLVNEEFS